MATAYLSPFQISANSTMAPVYWGSSSWGQQTKPVFQSPAAEPVSYATPLYPSEVSRPTRLEEQVETIDRLLTGAGDSGSATAQKKMSAQQMEDTLSRLQSQQASGEDAGVSRRDIFDLLKALQSEILSAGEAEEAQASHRSAHPSRTTSPTPRAPKDRMVSSTEPSDRILTEQNITRAHEWFVQDHRETRRTESRVISASEERQAFLRAYPAYDAAKIDALRKREYGRLDQSSAPSVYLDYTGGSLYAEHAQLEAFTDLLKASILGNPHSINPTSQASDALVEAAREAVAEHFHAAGEYEVIFTLNASNAVKTVGQCYPFENGQLLMLTDNHNSINGLREYAKAAGAAVSYVPVRKPELRASEQDVQRHLGTPSTGGRRLFAYPAQSNFSGVQHPLEWIAQAHARGWDVLLDAAAFVPTNALDLSLWKPDFVDVSFYKMFGLPTGVGALLVRKEKLSLLHRKAFFGGTVDYVGVGLQTHILKKGHGAFEDGTLDYLNIPAVATGLKFLRKVGINSIHDRVQALTGWLLTQLTGLRHRTGGAVVRLYGPATTHRRGGTVAVNFFSPRGRFVAHSELQEVFASAGVSLRYGCFCNPGAFEAASELSSSAVAEAAACRSSEERGQCMLRNAGVTGAVRISVGIASTFEDVQRFMAIVRQHFVDQAEE
eukprot:RCo027875